MPIRAHHRLTLALEDGCQHGASCFLAEASGKPVVFLDADDLLKPGCLESQIACLESARRRGRRVGLVTCDARLLDETSYAEHTYPDMIRDRNRPLRSTSS